ARDGNAGNAGLAAVLRAVAVEVVKDHALDDPLRLQDEIRPCRTAGGDVHRTGSLADGHIPCGYADEERITAGRNAAEAVAAVIAGCRVWTVGAVDGHTGDAGFAQILLLVAVEVFIDHALDDALGLERKVGLGSAAAGHAHCTAGRARSHIAGGDADRDGIAAYGHIAKAVGAVTGSGRIRPAAATYRYTSDARFTYIFDTVAVEIVEDYTFNRSCGRRAHGNGHRCGIRQPA